MYFRIILFYILLTYLHANINNDFIIDYFIYKRVSSVVGYTSNIIKGNKKYYDIIPGDLYKSHSIFYGLFIYGMARFLDINLTVFFNDPLFVDDILLLRRFNEKGLRATFRKLDNTSNINMFASNLYYKIGVVLDTRSYAMRNIAVIFDNATNGRMFDELYYWLILGSNISNILNMVNDAAFGISTDFVIAISSGNDSYVLYDVFNVFKNRGGILNVTFYGDWNIRNRLTLKFRQIKSIARGDLKGLSLRTMFFQSAYKPSNMSLPDYYRNTQNGTKDGRSKFGFWILSHLAEIYNFTIEAVETPKWVANDSIGPLIRAMMTYEVDLTGTPTNINSKRAHLVKFLHQDWPFRTCFIFRNPQPQNIKIGEILRPFADSVWFLMCLTIGLSSIILSLALRHDLKEVQFISMSNSFTMIIGAVCQQATCVDMKRISTRIAFFFIMIFSLVMYDYYSALVVSARLDEPIYKINDSLVEMAKIQLSMASERMIYLDNFWKQPYWETQIFYQKYWLKWPEDKKFMEPEVALDLVRRGGFTYHVHPDVAYKIIERTFDNREICELNEVHLGKLVNSMFGVNNNCTYAELVRVGLTKISEVGLRNRQILKWQYRKPRCRHDILSASSVDMFEFAPHLILLAIGLILAFVIYIFETISSRWKIQSRSDMCNKKMKLVLRKKVHKRMYKLFF